MGTLSLCMTASREPERVRAILALVRPVAAEVLGEHRRERGAPFYHLHYAMTSEERRLATVERFERALPGHRSEAYPVNALYLPERWSGVETAAVPEPDRPLIAAVARPAPAPPGAAPARVEHASVADVDRFNSGRTVPGDAYHAELRIAPDRPALLAGTVAHVEVTARNLGTERWPPAHHGAPLIRLAYRWLCADGAETVVAEGLRTPFEETVAARGSLAPTCAGSRNRSGSAASISRSPSISAPSRASSWRRAPPTACNRATRCCSNARAGGGAC